MDFYFYKFNHQDLLAKANSTRTIMFSFNVLTILLVGMGPIRANAYGTRVYTVYGKNSEYRSNLSSMCNCISAGLRRVQCTL